MNKLLTLVGFLGLGLFGFKAEDATAQESRRFFTFTPITEIDFNKALNTNFNAHFVTNIPDPTKLEKSFESIEKTYNEWEKELAKRELCNSPRCLTSFEAHYPTLDLYLFYILDNHYTKASFVIASTNEMASGYRRFRGSFGVMSIDGLWVGLEREGSDNYLQIEICKSSKNGVWPLFTFDFHGLDINGEEKTPMFWADKNTIYIATREYDQVENDHLFKYYALEFEY
ncbi:hypothetical protein [Pararhodonellum marinum]|uniref:hypothetical protein n=1 Tax=Pararhodonellum marinum TaxID=2755358 RepID=UPI00188E773B|nr:hypothetical protein [Pararhodonellum marinum]